MCNYPQGLQKAILDRGRGEKYVSNFSTPHLSPHLKAHIYYRCKLNQHGVDLPSVVVVVDLGLFWLASDVKYYFNQPMGHVREHMLHSLSYVS